MTVLRYRLLSSSGLWLLARGLLLLGLGFAMGVWWGSQRSPTPVSSAEDASQVGLSQPDRPSLLPEVELPASTAAIAASPPVLSNWEQIQQLLAAGEQVRALQMLRDFIAQADARDASSLAEAWLLLAKLQQQRGQEREAVEAWFTYMQYERDALRVDEAITHLKRYLLQLAQNPSLFGAERQWLIAQINALIRLTSEDGELHLTLARLHMADEDKDQAQYHALMAVNNPTTQARAETLLAELNDEQIAAALPVGIEIPLIRHGNQFLVELSLEGQSARLLLDTGASITGLTNQYLLRHPYLAKNRKPIQLNTASGKVDTYLFSVEQLSFAGIHFQHHLLAHLPMGDMRDFDGLLGVDILGRFDFVIDQNNARLRLSKRAQ